MKKFTVLILILLAATSKTFSQDSTKVSNEALKKAAVLIEEGKVCKVEREQLRDQNQQLQAVISVKDQRLSNMESQVRNYTGQITLKDETIKSLNKSLKNQRRKTLAMGVAALFMAASMTFLFNH